MKPFVSRQVGRTRKPWVAFVWVDGQYQIFRLRTWRAALQFVARAELHERAEAVR